MNRLPTIWIQTDNTIVHTGILVLHRENLSTNKGVNVSDLLEFQCVGVQVQSGSVAMKEEWNNYINMAALLHNSSENGGLGTLRDKPFADMEGDIFSVEVLNHSSAGLVH